MLSQEEINGPRGTGGWAEEQQDTAQVLRARRMWNPVNGYGSGWGRGRGRGYGRGWGGGFGRGGFGLPQP